MVRVIPLVLGAALLLAAPWDVKAQKSEGQALFETKCSTCHELDRPKSKKKTADGWEKTVQRMQQKRPSGISDTEVKSIVDYLTQNYGK